jgi:hypothetical protein
MRKQRTQIKAKDDKSMKSTIKIRGLKHYGRKTGKIKTEDSFGFSAKRINFARKSNKDEQTGTSTYKHRICQGDRSG